MRKKILFVLIGIFLGISHIYGQTKVIAVWRFPYINHKDNPQIENDVYSSISRILHEVCNQKEFRVRYTEVFKNKVQGGNALDIISFEPEIEDLLKKLLRKDIRNSELEIIRAKVSSTYSRSFQADLIIFGDIDIDPQFGEFIINILVLEKNEFREINRSTIRIPFKDMKKARLPTLLIPKLREELKIMGICVSNSRRKTILHKTISDSLRNYLIHYENSAWLEECYEKKETPFSRRYEEFKSKIFQDPTLVNIYFDNKIDMLVIEDQKLLEQIDALSNRRSKSSYKNEMCKLLLKRQCIIALVRHTAREAKRNSRIDEKTKDSYSLLISDADIMLDGINNEIFNNCK